MILLVVESVQVEIPAVFKLREVEPPAPIVIVPPPVNPVPAETVIVLFPSAAVPAAEP
jgi:hypothetical protein